MKLDYLNTTKIKNWLDANNIVASGDPLLAFKYYKSEQYHGVITKSTSISDRIKIVKKQIDYIQKSMVNILYESNGKSAKGMRGGYVYAIYNPAWPEYTKIGCAVDVYDRLTSYQTSSPHRDYELVEYIFTDDRLELESLIHSKFETKGEWVKANKEEMSDFLRQYKMYPDKEITDFCLTESASQLIESLGDNLSIKQKVKSVLKQYGMFFCEYVNMEKNQFLNHIESSKTVRVRKSHIDIHGTNLKYCMLENKFYMESAIG